MLFFAIEKLDWVLPVQSLPLKKKKLKFNFPLQSQDQIEIQNLQRQLSQSLLKLHHNYFKPTRAALKVKEALLFELSEHKILRRISILYLKVRQQTSYNIQFFHNRKMQRKKSIIHAPKKLVLQNERKSLYKVDKSFLNKIHQSQKQNVEKISSEFNQSSLKINFISSLKAEPRYPRITDILHKQETVLKQQYHNKVMFTQNQNRKKSFYCRRWVSQKPTNKEKIIHQSFQAEEEKSLKDLINQLFNKLGQGFIFQTKATLISVKRDKLFNIFAYLLTYLCGDQQLGQNINLGLLLKPFARKIKKHVEKARIAKKQPKLKLASCVSKVMQNPFDAQSELKSITTKIYESLKQQQIINDQRNQLISYLEKLKEELKQQQMNLRQCQNKILESRQQFTSLQNRFLQKQKEIQQQEQILLNNKQKVQNLVNFVQRQEQKKILHWVSQAYKQIETQLYDYASHLQSNSMASSLTWQPRPYRVIQEWIEQEMQRVIIFIKSEAEETQDKSQKMKDFVISSLKRYKSKDEQMAKIVDFKTSSIRKFISMMQKWMQNWQLKQEYLVDLRQQFVVQSENINRIIKELECQSQAKQYASENEVRLLNELKIKWHKVVLNYSYGNSFY